jgi:hypothetical protein
MGRKTRRTPPSYLLCMRIPETGPRTYLTDNIVKAVRVACGNARNGAVVVLKTNDTGRWRTLRHFTPVEVTL